MQQMDSQGEPPSRLTTMSIVGSPLTLVIATLVGTIIGAIISAIILGTAHLIDFSWIMLIMGCMLLATTVFFVWYSIRKGRRDRAELHADYQQFKENWESYFKNELSRWDKWAITYATDREKDYMAYAEELKRQCMEAIHDAEQRLDVTVKNAQSLFKGAVESQQRAVELYAEQLTHAQMQMQALEERPRKELQPDTTDQPSERD